MEFKQQLKLIRIIEKSIFQDYVADIVCNFENSLPKYFTKKLTEKEAEEFEDDATYLTRKILKEIRELLNKYKVKPKREIKK